MAHSPPMPPYFIAAAMVCRGLRPYRLTIVKRVALALERFPAESVAVIVSV